MTDKPDSFYKLPYDLQEYLLWEMDLYYDPYESSMAEAVHNATVGTICARNEQIIFNYYKAISLETLIERATDIEKNMPERHESLKMFIISNWYNIKNSNSSNSSSNNPS